MRGMEKIEMNDEWKKRFKYLQLEGLFQDKREMLKWRRYSFSRGHPLYTCLSLKFQVIPLLSLYVELFT